MDAVEDSSNILVYKERADFKLPRSVHVEVSRPGTSNIVGSSPTTLPAGKVVDCYLAHFDPVGRIGDTGGGTLSFSGEILGIIASTNAMQQADKTFAVLGKSYYQGPARGLEIFGGQDIITVSQDRKTIFFDKYHTPGVMEQLRIITEPGDAMGSASYGMNNQVNNGNQVSSNQVLMTDYGKTLIDLDLRDKDDDPLWIERRHVGLANVLFSDGSVNTLGNEAFFDPHQPHWKPLR